MSSTPSSPSDSQASAIMMPGPPALVTMATRFPRGIGWPSRAMAMAKSSWTESARSTPHWERRASVATSAPASAPVWEAAARAPAPVRPDFTTTMGFWRLTRRARGMNRRGFPKFSRYMRMTSVPSSSTQYSIRSLPLTSALFPTDTKWWIPMPYSAA